MKQCLLTLIMLMCGSTVLVAQTLKPQLISKQPIIVGLKTEARGVVVEAKVADSKNVQVIKLFSSDKEKAYVYAIGSTNLIQRGDTIYKAAGQNYYTLVKIDGSVSSVNL